MRPWWRTRHERAGEHPPAAAGLAGRGEAAFVARYDGLRARLPGDAATRAEGAAAFRRNGLPGLRDEAWHYTSLRPLAEVRFAEPLTPVAECAALMARLPAPDAPRLVFVDGRFRDDLSVVPSHAAVRVGGPAYGTLAQPEQDRLVALNTMLAEDGAAIEVAAGVDGGTLVLASLGSGASERPVAFHPRHSVQLGAGASLTLLDVSLGEGAYLHNPVFEVVGGRRRHADASAAAGRVARGVPSLDAVCRRRGARHL